MAPAPAIRNFIVVYPSQSWARRLCTLVIREGSGHGAAANFSGGCSRNTFHQINLGRTFVGGQELTAVLDEFGFGSACGLVQNHGGGHFFPQNRMYAAK